MAFLKAPPKQPKTTVVQLRLDDEARERLTRYAEFLGSSPSDVVTEALMLVCNKGEELGFLDASSNLFHSAPPHRTRVVGSRSHYPAPFL